MEKRGIVVGQTTLIGAVVVILVVLGAAVFFFSGTQSPTSTTTAQTTVSGGSTATTSISPTGGQTTINLTETEYAITPNTIYATPGEHVVLQVNNAGRIDHSIGIVGPGLNATLMPQLIAPGRTARLNFTVPASANGAYTFFCPVSGHEDLGMKGTLVVETSPQPSTVSTATTSAPTTAASTSATTAASTTPTTSVHSWG